MRRAHSEQREIELPEDGWTRLVVVSDSHSSPHDKALQWIRSEKPDFILHAGDIGRLSVLDELEELAETIAVRGNIDGHDRRTPDVWLLDVVSGGQRRRRILLTHIAVNGPRLRSDIRKLAAENGADVVICGHSHVPLIANDGPTIIFNPGSFGPRRFQLPITFGIIQIGEEDFGAVHIDCETGQPWSPPDLPS